MSARDRRIAGDIIVALVVAWITLAQFGSQGFGELEDAATDPDGLGFALVLLSSLPLLVRRRAPLAVLATTAAASVAIAALRYGVVIHLGPPVALYTLAAGLRRPDLAPVLAIAAPAYAAIGVLEAVQLDTRQDFMIEAVIWAAAWVVGDRRRLARERVADLHERAERAEREAEQERRLAAAEERARIARELHDSAGHALNTILVQAGAARLLREREPERSGAAIETVEQLARETIGEIDRLVNALREDEPAEAAPLPGVDAIAGLVERHRSNGQPVSARLDGRRRPLAPAVDRAAYRIVQEALTNAARHGEGGAELALEFGGEALELTIANPIAGHAPTRPGGGRGLAGMRERAALLGGTLGAGAERGTFRVRAVLPYEPERR